MVSSAAGERNYRYDFRVIYPMTTVSGESIRRTLGEPIGEVPCISAETFNRLFKPDPFDPTKLQKDTFEFVVEYPSIARVLGTKECPLRLDSCGTLKELPPSQVEGVVATAQAPSHIPFTLRNRITIASYSLMKNGEGPVFHWQDLRFLTQNDYCPDKVNIYYQTSRIVEGTKGLPYSKQKKFVEERGFGVMSFGPRMLSNVVQISAFRTCADRGLTLARTSDPVFEGQNVHQANIGNFNPRKGVSFGYDSDVSDNIGVVAGGLVEAQ